VSEPASRRDRILIVDDEPANVLVLERLLDRAGFHDVRSTTDPTEVENLYAEFDPDLILLDLRMPVLDGFEVMQRLSRLIGSDDYVPILVLTADVTQESKHQALANGAKDFVTKPFDHPEVLARVRNLLDTRFLHAQLKRYNELLERKVEERTHKLIESLEELEKADAERRNLMARLVAAQEEERQRIAADIHDDSVQVMTAAGIRLQILKLQLPETENVDALGDAEDAVNLAIARLRHLLFELRPPALDREGLAAALRLYLEQIKEEAGFDYALEDRLSAEPSVDVRVILYRIAQEAMANVRKHARARNVDLLLEDSDQGILVRIRDDGVGFSPEEAAQPRPGHLGFSAMRERAQMAGGWCKTESAPGAGTVVEFWVPMDGRM
jgi:signal transduction histidine kinase